MLNPRYPLSALLFASLTWGAWGAPGAVDLSVESVQPPKGIIVGQSGEVVVRLLNRGETTINSARLRFFVDGEAAGETTLSRPMDKGGKLELTFPWVPKTPGPHRVAVEAETAAPDVDLTNNRVEQAFAVGEKLQGAEVRLVGMALDEKEMLRDVPVAVTISIENSGDKPLHRILLTLFEDDRKVVSKTFYTNLLGHSQKEYLMMWLPKKAGKFRLSAVMGQADGPPPSKSPSVASQQVTISERTGHRFQITRVTVPEQLKLDQEIVTEVVVRNLGDVDAADVKVTMFSNGTRLGSSRAEVKAGQEGHFQLGWTPRTAGKINLLYLVESQGKSQSAATKVSQTRQVEVKP